MLFVMIELSGKRVLVTGASMGLGLAVATRLAREGASVILVSRGENDLRASAEQLPGGGHLALPFDVSRAAAWDVAMARIDAGGGLDGLVCAAGVLGPVGALDEIDLARFADTLAINVTGTALALHHALPRLRRAGGRAVTFSGGGGTGPLARYDAYATSKAAVVRLTENVAVSDTVAINCVAPGFVATRMHNGTLAAGPDAAGAEYFARTQEQIASGGFPAEEAAALVAFLLGPGADGITGRLISAQWDPWREPKFLARLRDDPDLGRVRRIDEHFYVRADTSG